ncbi:MAG: 5-oxoprolinase [Nitrospinaceae bacterium]|nr:MAG: 5-oxoprolinase [Nitrospinaceae bacterium]
MANPNSFRFSIDRGGTFTDIYAETPGEPGFKVLKLLSENPRHYADAPLEGIRRILDEHHALSAGGEIDPSRIEWVRMGTTVATNALLERKGARTALLISKGFGDLLQIGKQNRPRIFDLEIKKPALPYESVLEVDERLRLADRVPPGKEACVVNGLTGETVEILKAPDLETLRPQLMRLLEDGIESLAIVLMHSHTYPDHERIVGSLAQELGFSQVSLSSQVMPRIKIVDRGQTCCVDATLTPLIRSYIEGFLHGFKGKPPELFFMQSDGGLVREDFFTGSQAILSGPAGGVVGYAMTTFDGKSPVIGFDMGGTSTDVSRFDGEYEWQHESEVAGVNLQVPQFAIRTVAAGGGSRLFFKNETFQVGPESSGAFPGPVCYRNDGFLSLTDANLLLGRLLPEFFPKIFGPKENQPLDLDGTRAAFEENLAEEINAYLKKKGRPPLSLEEAAFGFLEVANENMARPIREISVARGHDIKEHVLACFGGAGGQHACALARALGVRKIYIHRFAGILSAYGLGLADVVVARQEPASEMLSAASLPGLLEKLDALQERALADLNRQGNFRTVEIKRYLSMRTRGTDTAMMIEESLEGDFKKDFIEAHKREFGFEASDRGIQVDDLRVRAVGKAQGIKKMRIAKKTQRTPPVSQARCYFADGWENTPVYRLEEMGAGEKISGPAIIIHETSTVLIEPACQASITESGDVEIEVTSLPEPVLERAVDPVQLAIFGNRFMSIAEQMGRTLQRTAISTNIKERQDFSCAVFGPSGDLVANAPHQPVHLGAMGEAVRRQMELQGKDIQPGDVWVTNHPKAGGSHLPDITVITPVLQDEKPTFFVASRGHHADVGGISPGSMPAFSKTLDEEGVCIESFKLVEQGEFQERKISALLTASSVQGTRALADNISDLKAQVAANQKGIELLKEMVQRFSLPVVQAYMRHLQENAEASVAQVLSDIGRTRNLAPIDTLTAEDHLDDGSLIRLKLTVDQKEGSAVFDFSGTGREVAGNLNAPSAVTHSAILYCLRCLIKSDIPLNQGCLNRIRIIIEEGSLLRPSERAAVAAGNVLTSQRLTDVLLKAFGACAASQGCMNNVTFGNADFGYYETIGGGAGAGPGWHGQSGVHTHMTNTRITDPEILESRYPVLLQEFSLRRGSGGGGLYRGGDGLIREMEFLEALHVAVLSERRVYAPYGLEGGKPGTLGQNLFIRRDGTTIDLGGKNEIFAEPGDRLRILTPGGGGYGALRTGKKAVQ